MRRALPLRLAAAAALVAAALVAARCATSDRGGARAGAAPDDDRAAEAAAGSARARPMAVAPGDPAAAPAATAPHVERAERALDEYEAFAAYPPWSRPYTGAHAQLLRWNRPDPIGQAFARDADGATVSGELALSDVHVGAGATLTATVQVWRGAYDADTRPPLPATVIGELRVPDDDAPADRGAYGAGWRVVGKVGFERVPGAAGTYRARMTPAAERALQGHDVAKLVAWVGVAAHDFPFEQQFDYATQRPITMHGITGDRITDGSLALTLRVTVHALTTTKLQAVLLHAADDRPLAVHTGYLRPTHLGPQDATIVFFGRALAQAGVDGPYRLAHLHALTRDPATLRDVFAAHDGPDHVTPAYRAADFSDAVWDSPEKRSKLALYRDVLEQMQRGAL